MYVLVNEMIENIIVKIKELVNEIKKKLYLQRLLYGF